MLLNISNLIFSYTIQIGFYEVQDHWIVIQKDLDSLWLSCEFELRFIRYASDLSLKSQS